MSFVHLSFDYKLFLTVWLAAGLLTFWVLLALRRRWRGRPKRVRLIHLALSLWMVSAALTVIELYYATVYDETDSFNISNVSQKWFQRHVVPDLKELRFRNGYGMLYRNDEEFPESLKPGQHHICFIGDSFTFGHGVPDVADRFSNRVAAELARRSPQKFIVSNVADAGKDVGWVKLVLTELFHDDRRVHTVVYVLCLNDIETFHKDHDKFYASINTRKPTFPLFRDTYFFNLLYYRTRLFSIPDVRNYYSFVAKFYSGQPWEKMTKVLTEIDELCRENRADFRIVIFPFLHNLGPDYEFLQAHRLIVEYCREQGIPVLDLSPVLTPHVSEGLSVNRFDNHPNERAHELAADAILNQLLGDIAAPGEKVTAPRTMPAK